MDLGLGCARQVPGASRQPRHPGPVATSERVGRDQPGAAHAAQIGTCQKFERIFQRHNAGGAKFDIKKWAARGPEPGRKVLALGGAIFLRLQDLATGSLPRQQRQAGAACAASVRTITGVTGASCITCKALKAALLLGLSPGSN